MVQKTRHDKDRRKLLQQLLDGSLLDGEFIDAVRHLDQSTEERLDAPANLVLLTNEVVREKFDDSSLHRQAYLDLLSLTYWHAGQHLAFGDDKSAALEHFRAAFDASLEAGADRHRSWRLYIAASIAYLENDKESVEENYKKLPPDDKNRPIIENFLRRLDKSQAPNYKADYSLEPVKS